MLIVVFAPGCVCALVCQDFIVSNTAIGKVSVTKGRGGGWYKPKSKKVEFINGPLSAIVEQL